MTDEELIKKLRDKNCCESPNCNCDISADRIEALACDLAAAKEIIALMEESQKRDERRIEALIADVKDAKAREKYWSGEYDTVLAGRADEYDRAEAAEAKVARLVEVLVEHNDLLRSTFHIAEREGVKGMVASTNWDAFYNRVAVTLKRYHEIGNEARALLAEIKGADHE